MASMSTNPYARFLDGHDPLTVVAKTPGRVEALAQRIGEAGMARTYGEGKWTAAQILCHLADVEISWGMRLRQAIAQPHHVIQPFDEQQWALAYTGLNPAMAVGTFTALRQWNLAFLATVPESQHGKPVTHPERGEMTFAGLVETMAGHDLNHLAQLEIVAAG
jgi:uncharacterized damage-inducible protein DinB